MTEEKIENEEKKLWENVKKQSEILLKDLKQNIIVQTGFLELATKKVEEMK